MPKKSSNPDDRMTRYQRKLLKELEELASIVNLDYWNIATYHRKVRSPVLEMMRRKMILSDVVIWALIG